MKHEEVYRYEWLRQFIAKRNWLCGDDETFILGTEERATLMNREPFRISQEREEYLLGFVDGWMRAKR